LEDFLVDIGWPGLPYEQWADTRDTLHLWTQVIGKVKLALTPFLNEWWNVALTLTCRGLTTGPMPTGPADLQIDVDFISQQLVLATSGGRRVFIDLIPRTVADFHAAVTTQLKALDVDVTYSTVPSELPDPVPFEQDTVHRAHDGAAAWRWWLAMLSVGRVMDRFRTPIGGKSSPVLFYWGGFDLNHTRFSGRPAPARPGAGVIQVFGEDQENFAIGFWPGNSVSRTPCSTPTCPQPQPGWRPYDPIHRRPGGCPVLASSSCRGTSCSPAPTRTRLRWSSSLAATPAPPSWRGGDHAALELPRIPQREAS
jgi:Family of unknown function (DUF5996)